MSSTQQTSSEAALFVSSQSGSDDELQEVHGSAAVIAMARDYGRKGSELPYPHGS